MKKIKYKREALLKSKRFAHIQQDFLAAVLTIVLGLILVNHAFGIALTMTRIGGIALLFNGVSDLWITRRVDQYSKSARKGSKRKKTGRNAAAGSGGSARFDTSDPDIIDAEDYHEL